MSRFLALVAGDVRERIRRRAYLATLAATGWLAWGVFAGKVQMLLDGWRGEMNSAWAGTLVASATAVMGSLVGFWVVKNTIERDRDNGVGEILAATPVPSLVYLLSKWASHLVVLGSVVGLLAAAALALQIFQGSGVSVEPLPLLAPFLLLALPAMAVVSGLAVFFETVPGLKGGFGNVAWFFLWSALLSVPLATGGGADLLGVTSVQSSAQEALRAVEPTYRGGFVFSIGGGAGQEVKGTFPWGGIAWDAAGIAGRCAWGVAGLLFAAVPALWFDRFSRDGLRRSERARPEIADAPTPAPAALRLTPLPPGGRASRPLGVLAGELRLAVARRPWWLWAAAAGLVVAGILASPDAARGRILPFCWLWPIFLWSALGSRSIRHGVADLVDSSPGPLRVQMPAAWLAGVLVALAAASGVAIRLLAVGRFADVAALLVGACFVPAAALALGTWSGSSKAFEGAYVFLWYVGPLQPVPSLDFAGAGGESDPAFWLLACLALLGLAWAGRARRFRA